MEGLKYVEPISPMKLIWTILLALVSTYLLISGTLFGLILLGVAIKLALRKGVEIAFEGRAYRSIYFLFGITLGRWKELPPIEYISVFETKKNSRSRVITAEATLAFTVFRLNLFYDRNKHIIAYETDNETDAFKVAEHLALVLDTTIHDATKN